LSVNDVTSFFRLSVLRFKCVFLAVENLEHNDFVALRNMLIRYVILLQDFLSVLSVPTICLMTSSQLATYYSKVISVFYISKL
jgi:hypothetical protein